jgi:8-oxo-dGTP diphosphatase
MTTSTKENPRLAAQAIVANREDRFLVVDHPAKKEARWRFPGGKLEKGEAPAAAARRELFEEVGVWADPFMFQDLGTEDIFIDGDFWRVSYFLIHAKDWIGRPHSKEAKLGDVRWVTKAELLQLDISGNMRAVVLRAL